MSIWKVPVTPELLNQMCGGTIHEPLGIQFSAVGDDYLEATMPVDSRTRQPAGLLHGGASAVLAESLGSIGSNILVYGQEKKCVGIEINANHLRSVREGVVTGRATAIHLGNTLHVWEIRIRDEEGKLVCVSRLTVAVLDKKKS
jgi:1,4-dihydroxy-2-naphthoyl-CoA hydrolase